MSFLDNIQHYLKYSLHVSIDLLTTYINIAVMSMILSYYIILRFYT